MSTFMKGIVVSVMLLMFIAIPFQAVFASDNSSKITSPMILDHFKIMSEPLYEDFNCDAVTQIPKEECLVLIAIFNDTNGPAWINHTGWLEHNDPCFWQGITCAERAGANHIIRIELFNNNLVGTLPDSIAQLSTLEKISFRDNKLTGTFTLDNCNLPNLQSIRIYSNNLSKLSLTGCSLPALQELVIYKNKLTGNIPAEILQYTSLKNLDMSTNFLEGSIPSGINQLNNLTTLSFSYNQLTGKIPESISELSNLINLRASYNQLTGQLPSGLSNLTKLENIDFEVNQLTGPIPNLSAAAGLSIVSLNNNHFNGEYPAWLSTLNNLTDVEFQFNDNFYPYTFPSFLSPEKNTRGLGFGDTGLIGILPDTIGNFTNMPYLGLRNSPYLHGPLPDSIVNLQKLTMFPISGSGLCVPNTTAFQTWLSVPRGMGDNFLWCDGDFDSDGVANGIDNAPLIYNPAQSDIDSDGMGDVADPCPTDGTNKCYIGNTVVQFVEQNAATLTLPSNEVTMEIPANALTIPLSITVTKMGSDYSMYTALGPVYAALGVTIGPSGTQFNSPVTLTFRWNDSNNDGLVDETGQVEADLYITKDGIAITPSCGSYAGCNPVNNSITFTVSSLSEFLLATPLPLGSLSAPIDPVKVGIPVQANMLLYRASQKISWDWGDGVVVECNQTICSHIYNAPGVYTINTTVNWVSGEVTSFQYKYVVIYNPEDGFVTGGGWINSPAGSYPSNPALLGKATFGFVSKYQKGANIPTGNTEFQFKVADLNFRSTAYDWLVVAGSKAQYKGMGTINGSGDYGFLLTAVDGKINNSGGQDKFRIKIWNKLTGLIVYDNQLGLADDGEPATLVEGGSITIHKSK